jgi:hypothetical protein
VPSSGAPHQPIASQVVAVHTQRSSAAEGRLAGPYQAPIASHHRAAHRRTPRDAAVRADRSPSRRRSSYRRPRRDLHRARARVGSRSGVRHVPSPRGPRLPPPPRRRPSVSPRPARSQGRHAHEEATQRTRPRTTRRRKQHRPIVPTRRPGGSTLVAPKARETQDRESIRELAGGGSNAPLAEGPTSHREVRVGRLGANSRSQRPRRHPVRVPGGSRSRCRGTRSPGTRTRSAPGATL